MTVDELVRKTVGRKLAPLAKDKRRSRNELDSLKHQVRELLINGLYEIFGEEHIVSTDEAIVEAYEQSIEPDIDSLFEYFVIEDYDRDSVPSRCERCISNMTEELTRIVEDYKRQDANQYEQQFKEVY